MAMQAFSLSIVAAGGLLGWDRHDELVEYRDRVVRLTGDLFDRVKRVSTEAGADAD